MTHVAPTDLGLLASLARHVPGVIYQFRLFPDGRSCFPFASEAMRAIYDVAPDAVREDASAVFARLHPEDLARVMKNPVYLTMADAAAGMHEIVSLILVAKAVEEGDYDYLVIDTAPSRRGTNATLSRAAVS